MTIHKEGYKIIAISVIIFGIINLSFFYFFSYASPFLGVDHFWCNISTADIHDFIFPNSKKKSDCP